MQSEQVQAQHRAEDDASPSNNAAGEDTRSGDWDDGFGWTGEEPDADAPWFRRPEVWMALVGGLLSFCAAASFVWTG